MGEKRELILAWLTMAEEKLEVARELVALSRFDDAVSRAYYAMFYAAKAILLAVDQDARSHSGVVSQFSQHFVRTGYADQQYSRILARAMQAREMSDYNPTVRALSPDAEQAIADAEVFLQKIREILSNLPDEDKF